MQSDSSEPIREDTVTADHEVPKVVPRDQGACFSFLILGSCVSKTHIQNSEQTFIQPVYKLH